MLAFTYYSVTDVARARKFSRFGFFTKNRQRACRASTKSLALLFEPSELKAASEQVNGRRDCLKVLSALVAAVRHPAPVSAL